MTPWNNPFTKGVESLARREWLLAAALVAGVFLAYQPAWQGGFLWDDDAHITRPELRSWHGLYRIWFEIGATPQYYPLVCSAFWVEHKLWGDATLGYHLVNIFLHCMAALMVALILRRLAVPGAYLAAAIFALHPVQVESVAWITELKNTLSGVFYLGTILLYLHFDRTRKARWFLGALGLFVLALLSKTATVMLPAVLPVIFWWQRGRLSWKRDVMPLAPFFLVSAMAGTLTVCVERKLGGGVGGGANLMMVERCLLAGRAIWFYLGKLFWPAELIFIYPRWNISPTAWRQYLYPAAALALVGALWALERRWRGPLAGLLFFVGTLFPVLGFFNVYFFKYSFVADHFQYLASLGIIALTSAGIALMLERWRLWRRPAGYMLCLGLLATLVGLTWRQCRMYTDIETLYQATIDKNPACWLAHNNLGAVLFDRGQVEAAIAHYRTALEINPDVAGTHSNLGVALAARGQVEAAIGEFQKVLEIQPDDAAAHRHLGLALAGRGRFDEAIYHYRKLLEIQPGDAETHNNLGVALAGLGQFEAAIAEHQTGLRIRVNDAKAHDNLGVALAGLGRFDEAIAHYRKALEIQPDNAEAHNNLGVALAGRGQIQAAITEYHKALEIKPDFADAHKNLGNALAGLGRIDEAVAHYRKALEIKPDFAGAHNNLGLILAGRRQVDAAIAEYRKALQSKPDDAGTHDNLGNALARRGQLDEAIAEYRRALAIRPRYAEAHCNLGNALAGHGQLEAAIAEYRKALEIRPDYGAAHGNFGNALAGLGRSEEAIDQFQKVLEINPRDAGAHYNLGNALAGRGQLEAAIAEYRKALEIRPDFAEAGMGLALALTGRGQAAEAVAEYQKVLKNHSDNAGACNNLAWIRATQADARLRDGREAVILAGRAVALAPSDPGHLDTLAAAYAEAGRFAEAAETGRKAVELARQQNKQALAESIELRLRLYEAGKPCREERD